MAIDSTAASITVGAALADGQTLKLGKNGAVETIIAPHGTAGSELYSVSNTAGTTDGSGRVRVQLTGLTTVPDITAELSKSIAVTSHP